MSAPALEQFLLNGLIAGSGKEVGAARKRRTKRGALPVHVPRIETVVDIDKACPCCKGGLHWIGEDVSERLDIVSAQFRVLVAPRQSVDRAADALSFVQAPSAFGTLRALDR